MDTTTGQLTQVQELGPLRGTLLTHAQFDAGAPGRFLYATASFGNNLVWVFQREADGQLTAVVDPMLASGRQVPAPSGGSYASALNVDAPGLEDLLLVAVEKENLIYAARRDPDNGGRLSYFPDTVGGDGTATGPSVLRRPVSMAFNPANNVLYVSEAGDNAISSYRLS